MNLTCQRARDRLLDGDIDANLPEHLRTCESCRAFAQELRAMDADLASLPRLDAPEALVDQTLARIHADAGLHLVPMPEEAPSPISSPEVTRTEVTREAGAPLGMGALLLASFSMLMAAFGALLFLPLTVLTWLRDLARAPRQAPAIPPPSHAEEAEPTRPQFAFEQAPRRTLRWAIPVMGAAGTTMLGLLWLTLGESVNYRSSEASSTMGWTGDEEEASAPFVFTEPPPPPASAPSVHDSANGTDPMSALGALMGDQVGGSAGFGGLGLRGTGRGGGGTGESTNGDLGVSFEDEAQEADPHRSREQFAAAVAAVVPVEDTSTTRLRFPVRNAAPSEPEARAENTEGRDQPVMDERLRRQLQPLGYSNEGGYVDDGESEHESANRRAALWQDAQRTTGLTFAAHDGWWENTYVPGDSEIRMLQARVAAAGGTYLSLAERAAPTVPAVAAPTERAIAVGVHADRAAIEGPTRVRVEVALRGIQQAAGRRGALRIALVVDTEHPLSTEAQARVRSLVSSLARSASGRDRVMLIGAGQHGGTLVPLGAMRAGAMEVALRHLFAGGDRNTSPTSLANAVDTAVQGVMSDDGAGLVLLATTDGAHGFAVEESLRRGALAGVVTSAIGLSANAAPSNLDGIALAGQGRRSLVLSDADATRVIRAELTATARLVARALRLRVRLAPGVELVEVIGSHPLDTEESRQTRATETAIDQQLSRRLGIASDRDDDQDGIRILLPSFHAGDSHTVVLDLLVTRPGPIVDVDVQFKDLVRLGNGNVSAALSLPSGTASRGVREQRVVASYIAQRVALALRAAGSSASNGDWSAASSRIEEARTLIQAARAEIPSLASSPSLQADETLLTQTLTALGGNLPPTNVADSLRYASHRRLLLPQLATIE